MGGKGRSGLILGMLLLAPFIMAEQPAKVAPAESKSKAANPLAALRGQVQANEDQPADPTVTPASNRAIPLAQVADGAEETRPPARRNFQGTHGCTRFVKSRSEPFVARQKMLPSAQQG